MTDDLENRMIVRKRGGRLGLAGMLLAAALSSLGCATHYISAGIGRLIPGKGSQQDVPAFTVAEVDYNARFNNGVGVGVEYERGTQEESSPGDPPNNIPSYDSTLTTSIATFYVQYTFGRNKPVRTSVRAGLVTGGQGLDTDVGEPVNDSFSESDSLSGASVGAGVEFGRPGAKVSGYVRVDQNFYDADNIPSSTSASTGATFNF